MTFESRRKINDVVCSCVDEREIGNHNCTRMQIRQRVESVDTNADILVVCNIFVEARIDNVGHVDGSYVIEKHVEPHGNNSDGETVTHEEDGFVLE